MKNHVDVAANRMPMRTRVFATVLDRLARASIVGMDSGGIRRSRARVTATVAPFTWITGRQHRAELVSELRRHLHPSHECT